MPKCWIHGSVGEKKEETTTKLLKEHPGFAEPNFKQNLALILTPSYDAKKEELITQQTTSIQNLEEDNQKKGDKIKDLKEQIIEIQKIDDAEIAKLNNEITKKNDRNVQLDKLFKGTAEIFNKQHNFVDQLKRKLELESKEKNISKEKSKLLQEEINRLEQQKKELNKQINELQGLDAESRKLRDEELENLKKELDETKKYIVIAKQNWDGLIKNITTSLNIQTTDPTFVLREVKELFEWKKNFLDRCNDESFSFYSYLSPVYPIFPKTPVEPTDLINRFEFGLREKLKKELKENDKIFEDTEKILVEAITPIAFDKKASKHEILTTYATKVVEELNKEKKWWDKWEKEDKNTLLSPTFSDSGLKSFWSNPGYKYKAEMELEKGKITFSQYTSAIVKQIHEYYKEKIINRG